MKTREGKQWTLEAERKSVDFNNTCFKLALIHRLNLVVLT